MIILGTSENVQQPHCHELSSGPPAFSLAECRPTGAKQIIHRPTSSVAAASSGGGTLFPAAALLPSEPSPENISVATSGSGSDGEAGSSFVSRAEFPMAGEGEARASSCDPPRHPKKKWALHANPTSLDQAKNQGTRPSIEVTWQSSPADHGTNKAKKLSPVVVPWSPTATIPRATAVPRPGPAVDPSLMAEESKKKRASLSFAKDTEKDTVSGMVVCHKRARLTSGEPRHDVILPSSLPDPDRRPREQGKMHAEALASPATPLPAAPVPLPLPPLSMMSGQRVSAAQYYYQHPVTYFVPASRLFDSVSAAAAVPPARLVPKMAKHEQGLQETRLLAAPPGMLTAPAAGAGHHYFYYPCGAYLYSGGFPCPSMSLLRAAAAANDNDECSGLAVLPSSIMKASSSSPRLGAQQPRGHDYHVVRGKPQEEVLRHRPTTDTRDSHLHLLDSPTRSSTPIPSVMLGAAKKKEALFSGTMNNLQFLSIVAAAAAVDDNAGEDEDPQKERGEQSSPRRFRLVNEVACRRTIENEVLQGEQDQPI